MKLMLHLTFPTEKLNEMLKAGTAGPRIRKIIEETKAEAAYFGVASGGERGAAVVVDIETADQIPAVTEPWYMGLGAKVETSVVMTIEDIGKIDYESLANTYLD